MYPISAKNYVVKIQLFAWAEGAAEMPFIYASCTLLTSHLRHLNSLHE